MKNTRRKLVKGTRRLVGKCAEGLCQHDDSSWCEEEKPKVPHAKTCFMGGYRGPTECCQGKCRHAINCNCAAGDTVDREYLLESIRSSWAELGANLLRLREFDSKKSRKRTARSPITK